MPAKVDHVSIGVIQAQYGYDPFGRATQVQKKREEVKDNGFRRYLKNAIKVSEL